MLFESLLAPRSWRRHLLAGGLVLAALGCGQSEDAFVADGFADDELTSISPTSIGKQSIGNCWSYAMNSWIQRLYTRVGGQELDLSEAYLTYWWWYRQLALGKTYDDRTAKDFTLYEGSTFEWARDLVADYGLMRQADFVPEDVTGSLPETHKAARSYMAKWFKSGAFNRLPKEKKARSAALRTVLDEAWQLRPEVRARLDAVFGPQRDRTIVSAPADTHDKYRIVRPDDLAVAVYQPNADEPREGSLAELVRPGPHMYAFGEIKDTATPAEIRAAQRRIQRVLHQGIPVYLSWWVNRAGISYLGLGNSFSRTALLQASSSLASGGGHATMLYDYQVSLPDGRVLKAGEAVTDKALLKAALKDDAKLEFWRIQNSWGTGFVNIGRPAGTYDLENDYLTVPMAVEYPATSQAPAKVVARPYLFGASLPADAAP